MALELKAQGNAALGKGDFPAAYDLYTKAIELDNNNAILYANRAQVDIKLEQYGTAIADASRAIAIDSNYIKSYYRRATAYVGTLDYKSAIADYQIVIQKAPADPAAKVKLAEARQIVKNQAFLRAIEVDDEPSVFESINIATQPDEDGLAPLDTDNVTLDWVLQMVDHFKQGKRLSRRKVYQLISAAKTLFETEPTMNEVDVVGDEIMTVCGDTHGQFYDLINIFERNGWPSKKHLYLFNGDFVDRGSWSTEIAFTLYALKLAFPNRMYLNRGNHETDNMNINYGFTGECKAKYSSNLVFKAFSESFTKLPLATLIGKSYYVVHGGLFSDDNITLDDVRKIDRFKEPQPNPQGLIMEMLWTDPQAQPGRGPSKRGLGLQFGPDVTKRFVEKNGLKEVIRSHEVRMAGYSKEHNSQLVTVFSAPNYCDTTGNQAAYLNIHADMKYDVVTFSESPHPEVKPLQYASNLVR